MKRRRVNMILNTTNHGKDRDYSVHGCETSSEAARTSLVCNSRMSSLLPGPRYHHTTVLLELFSGFFLSNLVSSSVRADVNHIIRRGL